MKYLLALAIAASMLLLVEARQAPPAAEAPTVILDVSVTDREGRPIGDLKQEEFQIEDDGKKVTLTNFAHVSLTGTKGASDGRTVALVLDDAGVPAGGTRSIQAIASMFLGAAGPSDAISVIRLHNATDKWVPGMEGSLARVASYQGAAIPFFPNETPEDFLKMVMRLSGDWEKAMPRRRRGIVCIGSSAVCNIAERESTASRDLYPNWVQALSTAARGNSIVYAAVPALATMTGGGLIERTGGEMYAGTIDFAASAQKVMSQLGDFYLLAYTPPVSKKDLKPVSVKVSRRDMRVRTRNRR
jgi:hypothetical protein